MVLGTDLAMLGGFGYATVQVVGKLLRMASHVEGGKSKRAVLEAWDEKMSDRLTMLTAQAAKEDALAKALKLAGAPAEECPASEVLPVGFGIAAMEGGQYQVFAEWAALPFAERVSLLEDLAELAVWAGIGGKGEKAAGAALRAAAAAGGGGCVAWASLSNSSKEELLTALDQPA
ncbi:MAG: hypothetical protein WDW38_011182 [Sanguina aurantia]